MNETSAFYEGKYWLEFCLGAGRLAQLRKYEYLHVLNGKAVPLQAWIGTKSSRKLRFPDFMTTAQDGGRVVSLTHRPPLPPGNTPGTDFCYRLSLPEGHSATGRIMSLKISNDTIGNRTRELLVCSALTTTPPCAPVVDISLPISLLNLHIIRSQILTTPVFTAFLSCLPFLIDRVSQTDRQNHSDKLQVPYL